MPSQLRNVAHVRPWGASGGTEMTAASGIDDADACSARANHPKRPLTERQCEALRRLQEGARSPRRNLTENQTPKARARIEALINANAETGSRS
jgi:hypothetical protein